MSAPVAAARRRLRRRDALYTHSMRFGPNMTPMVDVVLVILIFFMAATTFVGKEWFLKSTIRTSARGASAGGAFSLPPVRVDLRLSLDGAGRTVVMGLGAGSVGMDQMLDRLRRFTSGTATDQIVVSIRATGDVPYEDVVRIHGVCDALGIGRVVLGVE